jgi:hypothetical protein
MNSTTLTKFHFLFLLFFPESFLGNQTEINKQIPRLLRKSNVKITRNSKQIKKKKVRHRAKSREMKERDEQRVDQSIREKMKNTEAVVDEVIEGVAIAVVGEPVVGGREFLQALGGYAREVSGELRELGHDHRPSRHKAVDQRLLAHRRFDNLRAKEKRTRSTDGRMDEWFSGFAFLFFSFLCCLDAKGERERSR